MAKMKTMTRSNADLIASEVRAAMDKIAKKHGLAVTCKSGRYSDTTFRPGGIEFCLAESTDEVGTVKHGQATKKQRDAYNFYASFENLPALGTTFKDGRNTLQIVGWNSRASKNPIMLVDIVTGQSWKGPVAWVKRCLSK